MFGQVLEALTGMLDKLASGGLDAASSAVTARLGDAVAVDIEPGPTPRNLE
ncbi:hypothetical protein [Actinophytocola sp.]|uniref:hypothetical protein n=1 Tax=Actinophytocola sp. TaxID=1872138 RepID=UPI002D23C07D|nr:hypothetical protein [Actinophytocola sp.]HYQ62006.1 hypothetical protein [Actinophytocola sp.]